MLYLFDEAICNDLANSFNSDLPNSPIVKVIDPEGIVALAAQIQEDTVSFPLIAIVRTPGYEIDTTRTNFTRMHKGVANVLDKETNELYYEKAIPINLSYTLTVLCTNTTDLDEIVRELIFKYTSMYFLKIQLPYESDRTMRFGVRVDVSKEIEYSSGSFDYLSSGSLYQAMIPIAIDGAVLLHYTPAKLRRMGYETEAYSAQQMTEFSHRS